MSTVLITGASSGIWFEMARIFARDGYDLVLVARRKEELEKISKEFPERKVMILEKDLSLEFSPLEVYEAVKKHSIQIDILVNNAGFGDFGLFHEIQIEKQKQMINLNVRALTELTYLFGKEMVSRKHGKILNVASTAAFQPGPLMSVYYATKHYVLAFSEGLREEWRDYGVCVTTLCPGPTESGFQKEAHLEGSKMIEGKKLPTSKEVAEYGYRALMKWRWVAIHGFMNTLMAMSVRFTPRFLIVKIVKRMQEKRL